MICGLSNENPKHEDFKVCIEQSISSTTTPRTNEKGLLDARRKKTLIII